jgi:hypothetical protein
MSSLSGPQESSLSVAFFFLGSILLYSRLSDRGRRLTDCSAEMRFSPLIMQSALVGMLHVGCLRMLTETLGSEREEATGRKGLLNEELRGLNAPSNYVCYGNHIKEDEVDYTRSTKDL